MNGSTPARGIGGTAAEAVLVGPVAPTTPRTMELAAQPHADQEPISVSIVIPAYNEAETLGSAAERCLAVLRQCTSDYELVILDDGSLDRTPEVAQAIADRYPDRVRVIRHETNQGIAATFEELYRAATKDAVMLIPADNQYPPEALFEILPLLADHDIVICQRTHKTYTAWRLFVSRMYRMLPKMLFGVELYDPGSTKCLRREVITDTPVGSKGVFVEAERLIRAARQGRRIGKVAVSQTPRVAGKACGARLPVLAAAVMDLLGLWVSVVILRR